MNALFLDFVGQELPFCCHLTAFDLSACRCKVKPQIIKSTRNPKISGVFWSCWADSNRRPHPYQILTRCFYLLPLVVSCGFHPLCHSQFAVSLAVACCLLLCSACCGFSVTVAVFVAVSKKAAIMRRIAENFPLLCVPEMFQEAPRAGEASTRALESSFYGLRNL